MAVYVPLYVSLDEFSWPPDWDTEAKKLATIQKWESLIERKCRRIFRTATAQTVTLDGNDRRTIHIQNSTDPIITITTLTINGSLISSDSYTNSDWCVSFILAEELPNIPSSMDYTYFPKGFQNVVIVGDFGMAATPVEIKEAVNVCVNSDLYPADYEVVDFEGEKIGDTTKGKPRIRKITGVLEADRLLESWLFYAPRMSKV